MGIADYLLLAAVAVCAFFAFRTWRRSMKSGSCCGCNGNCAHCTAKCEHCEKK